MWSLVAGGNNRMGAKHVFPYQRQLTRPVTICIEDRIETTNVSKLNITYSTHQTNTIYQLTLPSDSTNTLPQGPVQYHLQHSPNKHNIPVQLTKWQYKHSTSRPSSISPTALTKQTQYTSSPHQLTVQALYPQAPVARWKFEFRAEKKISRNATRRAGWCRVEFWATRKVVV